MSWCWLRRLASLWVTVALTFVVMGTTTASAATSTYDAPNVARVAVRSMAAAAEAEPAQVRDIGERSALPPAELRGTSTTPSFSTIATNTGTRLLSPSSLADEIANATGGVVKANKGGFTINVPNGSRGITIRVMEEGGGRTNYYRVSVPGKGTYTVAGQTSTDAALTHIPIGQSSMDDILAIVERIQAGG